MALIDGISKDAAKALIDELATKYPPELIQQAITQLGPVLQAVFVGRKITVTIE